MACVRCGREIDADSSYCRFCGAPVRLSPPAAKRLTRLPAAGEIAGVCAGIAAYLNVDVTLVRLAWVVLTIVPGLFVGGAIAYVVAWAVLPREEGAEAVPARGLRRSASDVRIAGVCGGIAEYFALDPTLVRLLWVVLTLFPGAIVLGVIAYLVAWAVMPPPLARPLHTAPTTP